MPSKLKPTNIEEYIFNTPVYLHERLTRLHHCILSAAPGAKDELKWGNPAYSYQKILVIFGVFKNHTGLYPMPSALEAFKKELADYKKGAASVQFPHDEPLPYSLIKKIIKFRVKESKDGTITWRS